MNPSPYRRGLFSAYGYQGSFYQKEITYYDEGGLVYWTMGAPLEDTVIVNRCRKVNSYEYRLRHRELPPTMVR